MLHGNGQSIASYKTILPSLCQNFQVISVDSRAQGRSTDSEDPITYKQMSFDMAKLLDYLKIKKAHVVGWSDGADIGMKLAIHYPEKLDKFVSISGNYHWSRETAIYPDPKPGTHKPKPSWAQTKLLLNLMKDMNLTEKLSADPKRLPEIEKKLEVLWQKDPAFTIKDIKKITSPTLVMAGDHDLVRDEHTLSFFHALPNSQLSIIPNTSHLLVLEKPDIVATQIIEFLKTKYHKLDRFYFYP